MGPFAVAGAPWLSRDSMSDSANDILSVRVQPLPHRNGGFLIKMQTFGKVFMSIETGVNGNEPASLSEALYGLANGFAELAKGAAEKEKAFGPPPDPNAAPEVKNGRTAAGLIVMDRP